MLVQTDGWTQLSHAKELLIHKTDKNT